MARVQGSQSSRSTSVDTVSRALRSVSDSQRISVSNSTLVQLAIKAAKAGVDLAPPAGVEVRAQAASTNIATSEGNGSQYYCIRRGEYVVYGCYHDECPGQVGPPPGVGGVGPPPPESTPVEVIRSRPNEDGVQEMPPITVRPDGPAEVETVLIWLPPQPGPGMPSTGSAWQVSRREDGSYAVRNNAGDLVGTLSAASATTLEANGISVPEFLRTTLDNSSVRTILATAGAAVIFVPTAVPTLGIVVTIGVLGAGWLAASIIMDGEGNVVDGPVIDPLPPPNGPWNTELIPPPPVGDLPGSIPPPGSEPPSAFPFPIQGPNPDDIIFENGSKRHNERLAADRRNRNPSLRDPNSIVNQPVPGVPGAHWGYPTNGPRSESRGGADYQERRSGGVPYGVEVNVGGQIEVNPDTGETRITGGAWFDHVEVGADGVPEYREIKDWRNWPPPDRPDIWQDSTIQQAQGQVDAVQPIGGRVVWEVSTPEAAQALRQLFANTPGLTTIQVRHVP